MTNYVILARDMSGAEVGVENAWLPFTAQVAHSPKEAIRKALEGPDNPYGSGEYVAVPNRSWRPMLVTVQTTTEVKIA